MMTVREYNKAKQQKTFIESQIEELEGERDTTRNQLEEQLESQMAGYNAAISLLERKRETLREAINAHDEGKAMDEQESFPPPEDATNNGRGTKERSRRGRRATTTEDVDAQ